MSEEKKGSNSQTQSPRQSDESESSDSSHVNSQEEFDKSDNKNKQGNTQGRGWMPVIQSHRGCPRGLEYLSQLDQVIIKQEISLIEVVVGWEVSNKYLVFNNQGQQCFYAFEESGCLCRQCCGKKRSFIMHLTDNFQRDVLRIKRPFKLCGGNNWCACFGCCQDEVAVYAADGEMLGRVHQGCSIIKPHYIVTNSSDDPCYEIWGPLCNFTCLSSAIFYPVTDLVSGNQVANINKQFSGLLREYFTDADTFGIEYTTKIDVKTKAVLLGAVFLIQRLLAHSLFILGLCFYVVDSYSTFKFVGIGYNLLTGNPDGGSVARGGIDPGLLLTRKIFDLSPSYTVQSESRSSCSRVQQVYMYYGEKSYQDKLQIGVTLEGGANLGLASFAFSLSPRFSETHQETTLERKVFQDDQLTCNLGRQRLAIELANTYDFPLTENFASSVCQLQTYYQKSQYMQFIDLWGTHVTIEVELGTKNITRRESSLANFVEHVSQNSGLDVSIGGSYLGFGGSLEVDYEQFKASSSYELSFGSYATTLTTGTASFPEPIGLKLKPISTVLDALYWRNTSLLTAHNICQGLEPDALQQVKANLVRALADYASYKMAVLPTDPELKIPLAWPRGTYGLYMPISGCPGGNITWFQGRRYQDTENYYTDNEFSGSLHLAGTFQEDGDIMTEFCIKGTTQMTDYDLDWPKGDYCIAKYGNCPTGFQPGWLQWDDDDDDNINLASGILPDGVYGEDTKIYYCCRSDGLPTQPINLPNGKAFYLLRHTRTCQMVRNMNVYEEYVYWDEEFFLITSSNVKAGGDHPFDDGNHDNHKIHFCYYTPASDNSIVGRETD